MSIDKPTTPGSYEYTVLEPTSYINAGGESALYLVGMTGRRAPTSSDTIELYLVNAQPSFHPNGTLKDQPTEGGNSTIELFTHTPGSNTMTHSHTFFHPNLATPNNVAVLPDGSIYFTNDHGLSRHGTWHDLSPSLRTGDVSHCTAPNKSHPSLPNSCKRVASSFAFPNGLHYSSRHNILAVPSAAFGNLYIYRPLLPSHNLQYLTTIPIPYPIDNISEDSDGSLLLAAFPKPGILEKFKDHGYIDRGYPAEISREMHLMKTEMDGGKQPASTALRVRIPEKDVEDAKGWVVEKVIEDGDGEVLPASTTVVRDGRTGRLFLVGVVSEWISVCEVDQLP
jgi:arylesterase / paraoxonase